uniref:Uncharacterized protein n=1 Tax=Candidatus Kentrum sp. SD TaxID=2126332 RepID=A0A450YHR2_9GAMM|nr:MAG: hypothetical protein BECKSD772E_GA0070983_100941 [Candidatus Kentron sp. SD]VFK41954.1 MAG: hypothetical protein BECKSD772F_GA0070984_11099 [Candidatus Kentron sp. SD]VFK78886.1 MAG: hypothetical protein BECKSD772D_GA0070982_102825 [Candidatus Kentron sp. SD]
MRFRLSILAMQAGRPRDDPFLTIMLRVPITLENETTTPVGRVRREAAVTRQKFIKNVGLRRLRA